MRRLLTGLAVAALTVLALAGPASAARGQVTVFRFKGTFAAAEWFSSSATNFTDTAVEVSQSRGASPVLNVFQLKGNLDADGNSTGGTETFVDAARSGFSFAIDATKLASASVSGPGLPATTCTVNADDTVSDCTSTTLDVNVAWTGEGPITRHVSNDHFHADGFTSNTHFRGTSRAATATGAVGGVTLSAADVLFAQLGTEGEGTIQLCIGC